MPATLTFLSGSVLNGGVSNELPGAPDLPSEGNHIIHFNN